MGQYHRVVNLDKRQYINPTALGDGLKILEFGLDAGGTMTALAMLLAGSARGGGRGGGDPRQDIERIVGSWAGDRIAIVGDYAQDGDFDDEIPPAVVYRLCADPETLERTIAELEARNDPAASADAAELRRFAHLRFVDITPLLRELLERNGVARFSAESFEGLCGPMTYWTREDPDH